MSVTAYGKVQQVLLSGGCSCFSGRFSTGGVDLTPAIMAIADDLINERSNRKLGNEIPKTKSVISRSSSPGEIESGPTTSKGSSQVASAVVCSIEPWRIGVDATPVYGYAYF